VLHAGASFLRSTHAQKKNRKEKDRSLIVVKAGLFAPMEQEVHKHAAKGAKKTAKNSYGIVLCYNTADFKTHKSIDSRTDMLLATD